MTLTRRRRLTTACVDKAKTNLMKTIEMLTRGEYNEVQAALQAIKESKAYLQELVRPKLDKSLIEEVLAFINTIPCEYDNEGEREKIRIAVMLYIFAPEWFVFNSPQKQLVGIHSTSAPLQRALGMTRFLLWHKRKVVCDKYRRKGKFADKVDYVYAEVARQYKIGVFAEKK